MRHDSKSFKEGRVSCERCGGCCIGGGPILRLADGHLIRTGVIESRHLYTLRKGELLFDKDRMEMVPIKTDLIKIKVNRETLECMFLKDGFDCTVYDTRPSECRAFKCWDTKEIEMKYDEDPLERADLLSDVEGLWDLIKDHQSRCSYETMKELTDRFKEKQTHETLDAINEIVKYDLSLRETLVEKAKVNPGLLPFLLGRPFTETMAMFNLKIEEKDGKFYLEIIR